MSKDAKRPRSLIVSGILTGDCNELVAAIKKRVSQNSLNLAFLDPEGLELRWQTVATLASIPRMDLVINYPEGGLNRLMRQRVVERQENDIDRFFGTSEWRRIYLQHRGESKKQGLHRSLIDLYKSNLQRLGYQETIQIEQNEPLMRNTEKRAPLYRLLFASKHPLGHDFWQKVTHRDLYGQVSLF